MSRPPVTAAEVESALEYAHAVGAPSWLVAMLERHLATVRAEREAPQQELHRTDDTA